MIQSIKCKCGKVIAACQEPYCYEDSDWQKDVRDYSKKGYTVIMMESVKDVFGSCVCNKNESAFVPEPENQLSLFQETSI